MEANNGPVDFDRTWSVVQLLYPHAQHAQNSAKNSVKNSSSNSSSNEEDSVLLPCDILEVAEDLLNQPRFLSMCGGSVHGQKFLDEIAGFCRTIAARASLERVFLGLDDGYHYLGNAQSTRAFPIDRSPLATHRSKQLAFCHVTRRQLSHFFDVIYSKYRRSIVEPGEAVGAISGQSFGEPATQMTLKTFHFAGVASMDITQGVPRIKEIINAVPSISTPIITVELLNNQDEISARVCKGRLERTLLGEVAAFIKEVYTPEMCFLDVQLDMEAIHKLYLPVHTRSHTPTPRSRPTPCEKPLSRANSNSNSKTST